MDGSYKFPWYYTMDRKWVVVSNIFYFHPYLGKIPILTNIFQLGWNHQLDRKWLFKQTSIWKLLVGVCRGDGYHTLKKNSNPCGLFSIPAIDDHALRQEIK